MKNLTKVTNILIDCLAKDLQATRRERDELLDLINTIPRGWIFDANAAAEWKARRDKILNAAAEWKARRDKILKMLLWPMLTPTRQGAKTAMDTHHLACDTRPEPVDLNAIAVMVITHDEYLLIEDLKATRAERDAAMDMLGNLLTVNDEIKTTLGQNDPTGALNYFSARFYYTEEARALLREAGRI